MKAVCFEKAGIASEVLSFRDMSEPVPADGCALVEVLSRPIQPADLAFILGKYRIQPQFPQAAGLEGMGTVIAAPESSGLRVGQRVAFRSVGSWAERVAVPLERLIAVPDGIDNDVAAQFSLNPLTAWGLLHSVGARSGDAIAVTAGNSTVSQIIAELGRMRGIRVISIVRGEVGSRSQRSAAAATVSSQSTNLVEDLRNAANGASITGLLDSVGGKIVNQVLPVLAPGATMVAYGVMDQQPAIIPNAALIYSNLTWIGFGIDRWLGGLNGVERETTIDELWAALATGQISLPVAVRHALADFQIALRDNALPGRSGKVLLV